MAIDFEPMKAVNDHWGDKMPLMACEEMAELIQAISKYERNGSNKEDIIKEMADVYISCAALCNRYGITEEQIGVAVWNKMDRRY